MTVRAGIRRNGNYSRTVVTRSVSEDRQADEALALDFGITDAVTAAAADDFGVSGVMETAEVNEHAAKVKVIRDALLAGEWLSLLPLT